MATAKKTTVKKTTVAKKPPVKRAPVKKAPVKQTSITKKASAKATPAMRSFRVSPETSFNTFKITKQTVYWIVIVSFIIFMQLWILSLQMETSNYIENQLTTLNEES